MSRDAQQRGDGSGGNKGASVTTFDPEEWGDRERRLIEHFAVAMHELTSGSWKAAGWETKQHFRVGAAHAVLGLAHQGLDLLDILPKGHRG